jgi:DNA repair protein RadC
VFESLRTGPYLVKLLSGQELVEMLQGLDQLLLRSVSFLDRLDLIGDLLRRNFRAKTDLNDRIFAVKTGNKLVVSSYSLAADLSIEKTKGLTNETTM